MSLRDQLTQSEYTLGEIAKLAHVNVRTVYNWRKDGVKNKVTGRTCRLKARQRGGSLVVTREAYLAFDAAQNRLREEDP